MLRLAACVLLLAASACGASPGPSSTPGATPTVGSTAAPERTPTPSLAAETATDLLECDGPISDVGGRADDFGFTDSDRAAYVVTPEGIERWPRAEKPIGCA